MGQWGFKIATLNHTPIKVIKRLLGLPARIGWLVDFLFETRLKQEAEQCGRLLGFGFWFEPTGIPEVRKGSASTDRNYGPMGVQNCHP